MNNQNPLKAPNVETILGHTRGRKPPLHNYLGERWQGGFYPWSKLPKIACCYVIQKDGVTVYVGQTLNLRARFFTHRKVLLAILPKNGTKVKFHAGYRYGDWAMREARLINRLKPLYNLRMA